MIKGQPMVLSLPTYLPTYRPSTNSHEPRYSMPRIHDDDDYKAMGMGVGRSTDALAGRDMVMAEG